MSRGSVIRGGGPALPTVLRKARAEDLVVTLQVGELAAELAPIVHEAVRKAVAEVAPPPREVLTRKQVASLLGVNPHHIPRLVERGMPGHRCESQLRFLRSEVLAWVKSNKEGV